MPLDLLGRRKPWTLKMWRGRSLIVRSKCTEFWDRVCSNSTYQKCLKHELERRGLFVQTELELPIIYEGMVIDAGYRIDMLVEHCVIVENKAGGETSANPRSATADLSQIARSISGLFAQLECAAHETWCATHGQRLETIGEGRTGRLTTKAQRTQRGQNRKTYHEGTKNIEGQNASEKVPDSASASSLFRPLQVFVSFVPSW